MNIELEASTVCSNVSTTLSSPALLFKGYKYLGNDPANYTHNTPTALKSEWDQINGQYISNKLNLNQMTFNVSKNTVHTFYTLFQPDGAVPGSIPGPATKNYATPYCAAGPETIKLQYTVGDNVITYSKNNSVDIFGHTSPLPETFPLRLTATDLGCPVNAADACGADYHLDFSETCYLKRRAGAFCLSAYQNDYLDSLDFCDNAHTFVDEMVSKWIVQKNDTFVRNWANQSKQTSVKEFIAYTAANAGNSVDILFIATHGGVSPNNARLALWPDSQEIDTKDDGIRLGDFPRRLSILALNSCWVLSDSNVPYGDSSVDPDKYDGTGLDPQVYSGYMWNRWSGVFKGGLRIAVGGANGEIMSDGWLSSTDDNPSDFVDYMANRSILDAFVDAYDNWDVEQHVGGIASGKDPQDCVDRLQHMTYGNMSSYKRLYDSDVNYLCQEHVFHD